MKKIITIFAVVSLFLSGCSATEKPENKSGSIENKEKAEDSKKEEKKDNSANKENKSVKEDGNKVVFEGKPIDHDVYYDAYKSIIQGYANHIALGTINTSDKNFNGLALMLFNNSNDPNKAMQYTFYDVNNDNVAELLLRNEAEHFRSSPFAVYTLDNGTQKRLFVEDTLAERSYIQFFNNGNIVVQGSGGAFSGGITINRIVDFKEVEDKAYFYQLDKYKEEYFTKDRSEVIKFADFENMTKEWQPIDIEKLDWRVIK